MPPQHHARARAATRGPTPWGQHESDAVGPDDSNVGGGDVKKLVEHVLTTFSKFPEETLADMWRTKSRVLLATYASNGGNEYKLPRSN